MAIYRSVQTSFWGDHFVTNLSPEERYFYLYLLTNSKTSQCGIYELSYSAIAMETGFDKEKVSEFIEKLQNEGKIIYSNKTGEIIILNWLKYNFINSRNTILCMNKELKRVEDKKFLKIAYEICKEQEYPVDLIFQGVVFNEKFSTRKYLEEYNNGVLDNWHKDTAHIQQGTEIAAEELDTPENTGERNNWKSVKRNNSNNEDFEIFEESDKNYNEADNNQFLNRFNKGEHKQDSRGMQGALKPLREKEIKQIYINKYRNKNKNKDKEVDPRELSKVVYEFCKKIGEPSLEQLKKLKSYLKEVQYSVVIRSICYAAKNKTELKLLDDN